MPGCVSGPNEQTANLYNRQFKSDLGLQYSVRWLSGLKQMSTKHPNLCGFQEFESLSHLSINKIYDVLNKVQNLLSVGS